MAEQRRFTLEIDASPEWLSVARLFVASVLRHVGAAEDDVADARLALSELGASALLARPESRLTVSAVHNEREVCITLSPFASVESTGETIDPLDIVQALYPDAVLAESRAEFTVRLPD